MANIDSLRQDYQAFRNSLDEKDFVKAQQQFERVDAAIRALDRTSLESLSQADLQWLEAVGNELQGQLLEDLQQESEKLIEIIAPFNKNSALKKTKHY